MKLYYHKGKNFGDQLNPMIFDYFLPHFFDENDSQLFVGIGSLIGLVSRFPQSKVVFSSGLADGDALTYGPVPHDLSSFDFICVRGPLTADRLKLNPKLAITDGAILLAAMKFDFVRSHEVISFMPHAGSEQFYDHQRMAMQLGWQFISPTEDPLTVMKKMMRSKFVITEAMHGAIVADTLRIPWIPYVGFSTVNEFKWKDWCLSMEMVYQPFYLNPYYDSPQLVQLIKRRLKGFPNFALPLIIPLILLGLKLGMGLRWYRNKMSLKKTASIANVQLSSEEVFSDRLKRMLEKVEWIKKNR